MSIEDFLKEAQEQNFWEVTVDYEELKALRDYNEHFFECGFLPLVQVDMVDMLVEDEYANWVETENTHNYTDRDTGLPIPPDDVAKLLQRKIQDQLWWEAIEKEINGLDEQGVYIHNLTRDQLREMGKIPDMPIVPSRFLLTVKVDSEEKFTKCKARQILFGHKGFVKFRLTGGLLWPIRNAYPAHSFAVSQLCKLMQSPCEKAWLCALQCLHHLYEHRNDGITYRSDCSLV
jgi:hypothetical protein